MFHVHFFAFTGTFWKSHGQGSALTGTFLDFFTGTFGMFKCKMILESTLGHFFNHYTTGYLKSHYVIIKKNNTTGYLKTHYVIIRKNNIISTLYKIHFLYNYTTGYLKTNYVKLPFNGLIIHLKNNIISGLY